jgi:hypothetical protein
MKTIDVADDMKQMKIGDLIDVCAENVFTTLARAVVYAKSRQDTSFVITYDSFTQQITIERK